MELKVSTLHSLYKWTGLLFFCGYFSFVSRLFSGGGGSLESDLQGNILNQLFGLLCLVVGLFFAVRNKYVVSYNYYRNNWTLVAFFMVSILSFLWSIEPSVTIKRSIAMLSMILFCYYLVFTTSRRDIFRTIGLIFSFAAIVGFIFAVIMPEKAFIAGGLRAGSFIGIYADKNGGARTYTYAILLLLPFALNKDRLAMWGIFFCLVALAFSRSASAILILLIGLSIAIYMRHFSGSKHVQVNSVRVISGLILLAILGVLAIEGYAFALELAGRDATLTDRTQIWEFITPMVWDKAALGYGFGAFWAGWAAEAFIERWKYIGNAHNGYIEIMLNGGFLAMFVFLLLCMKVTVNTIVSLVKNKGIWFNIVTLAIILQMLIVNYVAYVLPNYRSYDFFLFLILAIGVMNNKMESAHDSL